MINRRFVMDYPQRVSALVILNSPHQRSPQAQKAVEDRALKGSPAETLDSTIKRWFTAPYIEQHPEVIEQVRQWLLANDAAFFSQCRHLLATGVLELVCPNPPINRPVLVMTSENDSGSTPAMSHAIAEEISAAKTIVVPELQHMGLMQEPLLFTGPIIHFLNNVFGIADNSIKSNSITS